MKGKQPYHSPDGYRPPSQEEKEINALNERVDELEYVLTELVKVLYNKEYSDRGYQIGDIIPSHSYDNVFRDIWKLLPSNSPEKTI